MSAMDEPASRSNPLLEAMRPQATGNLLIVFREDVDHEHRLRAMERAPVPGTLSVTRTGELGAEPRSDTSQVRLFERLGIAVVHPQRQTETSVLQGALSELDEILEVWPEYYLFPLQQFADTQDATWGLEATGVVNCPFTGRGIRLAVLDTGLDRGHPDFAGRHIVDRSFIRNESIHDVRGHGTHCAGTAAGPRARGLTAPGCGCAPDAELYIGKVLNDAGYAEEGTVAEGMDWAIGEGCHVISMSLGRSVRPGERPTAYYERLGRDALASDCLIVAAAGNDSSRSSGYIAPVAEPANAPSILAVGAVDAEMRVAPFSNGAINPSGGAVDIAAPGVGVFSAFPRPRNYEILQGTSMACPHVAGIAALWAESDRELRGAALWQALLASARTLQAPQRDVGAGLVQAPSSRPSAVA